MNKPLMISFGFHGFCFAVFAGLITLNSEKPLDIVAKPEKPLEVSFYAERKPDSQLYKPPQIKKMPIVTKPIAKIPVHKPIYKQAVQTLSKTPKAVPRKYIIAKKNNDSKESMIPSRSRISSQVSDKNKALQKTTNNIITQKQNFNEINYIAEIKKKIAHHKFYPDSARRRFIEGRIALKLSVNPNGNIQSLHVLQSSGSEILDEAALQSVYSAAPFKNAQKVITFQFAMQFNLQDS